MEGIKGNINSFNPYSLVAIGLILLAYALLKQIWLLAAIVVIMPFLTFYIVTVLNKPYWGFMTLFTLNYFFIGILRYVKCSKQQCNNGYLYCFPISQYISLCFMRG